MAKNYHIDLDIRAVRFSYDTEDKRDTDFSKIVKFLTDRGVTTYNASLGKKNSRKLYDKDAVLVREEDVTIPVTSGGLPEAKELI